MTISVGVRPIVLPHTPVHEGAEDNGGSDEEQEGELPDGCLDEGEGEAHHHVAQPVGCAAHCDAH